MRAWTFTIRQGLCFITWVAFLLGLSASIARHLPFNIGFRASRSDLDRFATENMERIGQGRVSAVDQRIGPYRIKTAERVGSSFILVLDVGQDGNKYPEYGLIRMSGQPKQALTNADLGLAGDMLTRVRVERIADDWFVFYDWYWYIKDGWS